MDRRRFLRVTIGGSLVAVAGCVTDDADNPTNGGSDSDSGRTADDSQDDGGESGVENGSENDGGDGEEGTTEDRETGSESEAERREPTESDLLLRREGLPGDGWEKNGPAVGGPIEYINETRNLVVRSSVTVYQSTADAKAQFDHLRERARQGTEGVSEKEIAQDCIVYEPDGVIQAAVFFEENVLGELRVYRHEAGTEASTDRIEMADIVRTKVKRWPFE